MSPLLAVFHQYKKNSLRDRFSLFWTFLFPLVLLTILILFFSGASQEGVQFSVGLVNKDLSSPTGPEGVHVSHLFNQMLTQEAAQEESWLRLYSPDKQEDLQEFLDQELEALSQGRRQVVIVIPEGFNQMVLQGVGQKMMGFPQTLQPALLEIYHRSHHQTSEMVASIFEGITGEFNREISLEVGFLSREDLIPFSTHEITGAVGGSFSYRDYIVPGVILMSFIMTGLYFCFESLLSFRERGILRRYFVTPLSPWQYFGGLLLWVLFLSFIQMVLVYGGASLFFQVNLGILSFSAILYYLYALVVFVSFGFLVASLAKTADSGAALANILLYPMMFLGGLFFPVEHVPAFLQVFIYLNPATYLVNGIRDSLGVYPSFTSPGLNLLIPGVWLLFSILYSSKKFSWEVS